MATRFDSGSVVYISSLLELMWRNYRSGLCYGYFGSILILWGLYHAPSSHKYIKINTLIFLYVLNKGRLVIYYYIPLILYYAILTISCWHDNGKWRHCSWRLVSHGGKFEYRIIDVKFIILSLLKSPWSFLQDACFSWSKERKK